MPAGGLSCQRAVTRVLPQGSAGGTKEDATEREWVRSWEREKKKTRARGMEHAPTRRSSATTSAGVQRAPPLPFRIETLSASARFSGAGPGESRPGDPQSQEKRERRGVGLGPGADGGSPVMGQQQGSFAGRVASQTLHGRHERGRAGRAYGDGPFRPGAQDRPGTAQANGYGLRGGKGLAIVAPA
jgi:hypothetical protein